MNTHLSQKPTHKNIKIKNDMQAGTIHKSNSCGEFEIIEYVNSNKVKVRFIKTGYTLLTVAQSIRKGLVKDALQPSVYGVGFIGDGIHRSSVGRKHTKEYNIWKSILQRCYDTKSQEKNRTYIGCSVSPVWHNFQNFAEWFNNNYIEGYHIDKDLKIKGNKVYSPETCLFVPRSLNNLFLDRAICRGKYPVGVSFYKREGKFSAEISIEGKRRSIGMFSTYEQASVAYQQARSSKIKRIIESNVYGTYLTQFIGQHI